MGNRLYIISHSSLDIASTIQQYERNRENKEVFIVTLNRENFTFLRELGLGKKTIFIEMSTDKYSGRKHAIFDYIRAVRNDALKIKKFVHETNEVNNCELIFHSLQGDPYSTYLAISMSKTAASKFIDVVSIKHEQIFWQDFLSVYGLKVWIDFSLLSLILGPIFRLCGTRELIYPVVKNNQVEKNNIMRGIFSEALVPTKYLFRFKEKSPHVVLMYDDSYAIDEGYWINIFNDLLELILNQGFSIYIKPHPKSQIPTIFEKTNVHVIPKHIPSEFVDTSRSRCVIGVHGASLLGMFNCPIISITKFFYPEFTDLHEHFQKQLKKNKNIIYPQDFAELENVLKHQI